MYTSIRKKQLTAVYIYVIEKSQTQKMIVGRWINDLSSFYIYTDQTDVTMKQ